MNACMIRWGMRIMPFHTGSIILFRIVERSFMELDVPPGLIATRRRPGKTKVCLYVNERWCKTVIVSEQLRTSDIELLSVSLRPRYLPREWPHYNYVPVVYIDPKANVDQSAERV